MSKTARPILRFLFPDAKTATDFLSVAKCLHDVHLAQNPLRNGKIVEEEVWVTGSGSTIFDLKLESALTEAAENNGGCMLTA